MTNHGEKVSNKYKAIILFVAILDVHKEVRNEIKYWRDVFTPNIVIDSLKSKEKKMTFEINKRKA